MDQNHTPNAPHNFTEEELRIASHMALAAAHRYPPTYFTEDFQPHFWVVAAVAQAVREIERIHAFTSAVGELESLDHRIKNTIHAAQLPDTPTANSFASWYGVMRDVRGMLTKRDELIAIARKSAETAPPAGLVHLFCGVRDMLDRMFAATGALGYSGGDLTQEQFETMTAHMDFASVFRRDPQTSSVPEDLRAKAAAMQAQLSEKLGPGVTVRVAAVQLDTGDIVELDDIADEKGKEGGNGSIH